MRDSFPPGFWAAGSPGDPDPDGLLPAGIAESLLDGRPGVVPMDLRPLGEALAALRAAPSATEFRGEEAALAAFRSIHGFASSGSAYAQWTAGPAPTVPLEIPPGMLDHRLPRARHAAPRRPRGRARPPARAPVRRAATRAGIGGRGGARGDHGHRRVLRTPPRADPERRSCRYRRAVRAAARKHAAGHPGNWRGQAEWLVSHPGCCPVHGPGGPVRQC